MTNVIINPGSGPVEDATIENAKKNIKHYILDCGLERIETTRLPDMDENGRFSFLLWSFDGTRCHVVEMPGIPLSRVRYMKEDGQDIWDFPRLYIDGSSWIWCFSMLKPSDFEMPEAE